MNMTYDKEIIVSRKRPTGISNKKLNKRNFKTFVTIPPAFEIQKISKSLQALNQMIHKQSGRFFSGGVSKGFIPCSFETDYKSGNIILDLDDFYNKIWCNMQNVCESVVRCLCSCLISKTQIQYRDVNQEHHEFIKLGDQVDDDHRTHRQQKEFFSNSSSLALSNKMKDSLEEDKKVNNSSSDAEIHSLINSNTADISSKEVSLLELKKESNKTYTDVMPEDHPYYHLFKQKLVDLGSIFEVPAGACIAEPETSYPLRMHCFQEGKLNCFKYFYRLPTDYHTYEAISNDFELQRQFDPNIDEFRKVLETPGGDAKLIYLSYKKVLIMSSRDFEYIRYTFKKDDEFWNICISDMSREEVKGKVRGEMLLTATRIIEHAGEIEVSVSSTTDMKIPIKLEIAKNRGFAEIRKYLDRVYQYIKEEEGKSII